MMADSSTLQDDVVQKCIPASSSDCSAENGEESTKSKRNEKITSDGPCSSNNSISEEPAKASKVETDSQFGSYITEEFELLYSILSHLPVGNLNQAAQVCRKWQSAAKVIRQTRIKPHWLLWRRPTKVKTEVVKKSLAYFPHEQFREAVFSEPVLALMFTSQHPRGSSIEASFVCPIDEDLHDHLPCEHSHNIWEYLKAELQPQCPLFCFKVYGVVGTTPDLSQTVEIEHSGAYTVLLLPDMPDVEIFTFHLKERELMENDPALDYDPLEHVDHVIGIPPGKAIKCLLLFTASCNTSIEPLVHRLQSRQDEVMVVAGGVVGDVSDARDRYIRGIAITGNGVSVSSTLLDSHLKTQRRVNKAMEELKAHTISKYESSVGLMFACVGRGKRFYKGNQNVESAEFRRCFPNTPLVGFFGNGEIGFSHLPDVSNTKQEADGMKSENKRRKFGLPIIQHSYSTAIVHLAFTGKCTRHQ